MKRKITKIEPLLQPMNLKRVAAYARVSTTKDAMLHSLAAQVSYYSDFIQSHPEWEYIGVYADEAQTGTKDSRSEFQRMLSDCKDGKIDMIITKSISRFARNTVTLLETVRALKEMGIDVYFEEQNIHSTDGDGELMLTILASFAQEESLSASENQKWRIRKGFENGELLNLRFLYGYNISKGIIEINKAESEVVRYIFSEFIGGTTIGSIARKLNSDGKCCTHGGKWSAQRIRDVLSNEKYIGDALLQKKYRNNHIDKKEIINNGVLPKYYAEGTHDAIIDTNTFNKAQNLLKLISERFSGNKPKKETVFRGKIQCQKCGKNYKRQTSNGTVGWNCSTYLTQGKSVCHGKKIPETTLKSVCNEILDINCFDENLFAETVKQIIVPKPNHLTFILYDGNQVSKEWNDRSRRDSWTEEMKQVARERTIMQRGKEK